MFPTLKKKKLEIGVSLFKKVAILNQWKLLWFCVVAHGVNLCYKLGQSVADMTDGLCWLWTQLWLCPKQGTASLLPQTKAELQKVKNSEPVFFTEFHSKVGACHQTIFLAIFMPGPQLRTPASLCFSHCATCLVVWQRKEKTSENIVTFHKIWNLMARWNYILTNSLMMFE